MIGDIVLQKRSGVVGYFVSFFTRSEWVHCGIYVGDGSIVHVDWRGKRYTYYSDWADGMIVLTPVKPLTSEEQAALFIAISREKVAGYSFWNAVKSWIWKDPDDNKKTGKRYHCASFVSAMYRKIGIDLVPGRSDDTTQPQEFLDSPLLRRVV